MIILGTNSIKDAGGFNIANSLRFNSGSSDNLSKTFSSNGTRTKWTLSMWVKRSKLGAENPLSMVVIDANNEDALRFNSDDTISFTDFRSGGYGSGGRLVTNRVFRDVSAWYNLIFRWDTGDSTADNRMKIWVNGVEETSFAQRNNPSTNTESLFNSTNAWIYGAKVLSSSFVSRFDGYMAEVVFCDNQKLEPTSFGEFDSDSGIWKPINVSGLTFGTNGFYLDFEDSSALGNDAAGSNNFTVNNLTAIDQSTDTCTNNFATLNPLYKSTVVLSEGNVLAVESAGSFNSVFSTIGASSGKWYAEFRVIALAGSIMRNFFGIVDARDGTVIAQDEMGNSTTNRVGDTVSVDKARARKNGSTIYTTSITAVGDIVGVYLDLDNGAVYFSENGSLLNSGDPSSGSSKTGAITITVGETYLFGLTAYNSSCSVNFGNPHIAPSSANTDANGYGSFEYSPTVSGVNYYALNTKNLAEYG